LDFWSDAGGTNDIVNGSYIISDSAASALPTGAIPSGTYRPADYETAETSSNWGLDPSLIINHPATNGVGTLDSVFGGIRLNGTTTWSLYITDDAGGDVGSLVQWGFHIIYNIIVKPDDFNGDNSSDILWRNDSGQVYFWNMNGTAINSEGGAAHAIVPTDWHIEGTGDFDGDAKSDILWRHDSGQTYIWEMNTLQNVKAEGTIAHAAVGNDWQIQGAGDFDGDAKSDILWRHDSGQVYIWEMNGLGIKAEGGVAHALVPSDWQIQGLGDFDGDAKSDILWRHDSGQVYIWEMNGPQRQSGRDHRACCGWQRLADPRPRRLQQRRQQRHSMAPRQRAGLHLADGWVGDQGGGRRGACPGYQRLACPGHRRLQQRRQKRHSMAKRQRRGLCLGDEWVGDQSGGWRAARRGF
jgi:FG-GAP-like repeat